MPPVIVTSLKSFIREVDSSKPVRVMTSTQIEHGNHFSYQVTALDIQGINAAGSAVWLHDGFTGTLAAGEWVKQQISDCLSSSENYNHPQKGSMIKVEPLRKKKDVELIKVLLKNKPMDLCYFIIGINTSFHGWF